MGIVKDTIKLSVIMNLIVVAIIVMVNILYLLPML